jgi:signal transduction histidine kinase
MHDLRNPLSGIRLSADLIDMLHEDPECTRCCDGIRIQCDRVVAMATDLLDVSRGEVKLHLRRTDTAAFLEQFEVLNHDYLSQSGVYISIQAEPAEIEIDAMRLLRLLQNLVTNAIEALDRRSDGKIEVRAFVEEGMLKITVEDNGPGISEVIRHRIFEPFATFGKKSGTGLGMAIVRNVVQAHHGTITFETEAGKGTRFLVQLPQFQAPPHVHAAVAELVEEETRLPDVAPVDSACVEEEVGRG